MARTTIPAADMTHHLRAWRKAKGLTLEQLAEAIGMSHQNLGRIERGLVPLGGEHHGSLARALGITAADIFRDPNEEVALEPMVPIIGRVGADAEGTVVYITGQASYDTTPIPPGGTSDSVALEVVGSSMRAIAEDGGLIYFENQHNPPTPDMLGYVVIVETEDGRVLVKRLLRGSKPGHYDLESQIGPTITDVRLRWAAEPTAIIPPKQARRIIRRAGERQVA
jgi:transcriptional regulator with XRE-family HTH domain